MSKPLQKLRDKLCRELAQSEHDAVLHCAREARRYGSRPPGHAMRVISDHARELHPRLAVLWGARQQVGARAGRAVGDALSAARDFAVDWVIDAERSYRATLLGVRHGIGVAQLLRHVLARQQDTPGLRACDELIDGRLRLVSRGEDQLDWFAAHPDIALRSSRRRVAKAAAGSTARAAGEQLNRVRRSR
jgi:hypothetical protein